MTFPVVYYYVVLLRRGRYQVVEFLCGLVVEYRICVARTRWMRVAEALYDEVEWEALIIDGVVAFKNIILAD